MSGFSLDTTKFFPTDYMERLRVVWPTGFDEAVATYEALTCTEEIDNVSLLLVDTRRRDDIKTRDSLLGYMGLIDAISPVLEAEPTPDWTTNKDKAFADVYFPVETASSGLFIHLRRIYLPREAKWLGELYSADTSAPDMQSGPPQSNSFTKLI